ncbi:MAG: tetratricopeptide repeat protein [Leptolyngbyaceae cyanobacterium bins.349]|nr:tetratricopeptide repeat protein [Leptolyngbyaceae cyanobacterium bins.349]
MTNHNELKTLEGVYQLVKGTSRSHRPAYLNQSDREMLLRQRAMEKAQQGDPAAAIDLFTQLIRANPNSASNFNNRGLLHFQTGQLQRALMDYHHALMLNPRLGKVYNNRANCYATLGNLDAAIADYETAIDLDPTDIRARLNLGITYRQLEDYHEAIENFDMALQCSQFLNTTDAISVSVALDGHLFAERGRTYHLLGDWNYAIADYNRALAQLPLTQSALAPAYRLRTQVRTWLHDLLSPLQTK